MKSVFLSILYSILLTNSCLAMEQSDSSSNKKLSHSISTEKLADWETLDSDDIKPVQQALDPVNNKKPTGWFLNIFRNSSTKSTPQTVETPTIVDHTIPAPKLKKKTVGTVTPASVVVATIATAAEPQAAVISNPTPLIVVQNQEQQDVAADTVQAIISIKKISSLEKLCSSDNAHDVILPGRFIIASQAISPIISPLQFNKTSQSNSQDNLHSYDSDSNSSTSTQMSTSSVSILMNRLDHSVEIMNIDRDSNSPSIEQFNPDTTSLLAMFQNGCCSCFDGLNDSESKKKSNK